MLSSNMLCDHPPSETMASPRQDTEAQKDEIIEMSTARDHEADEEFSLHELDNHYHSTSQDAGDMRRMGRSQELVRHFRSWSMVSFVAVATSAWEFSLFGITPGLTDGGRPVLLWAFLWSFLGFIPVYLSMAEMASMAPIAGAQYHWVSEFAPEKYQKILSYLTGYVSPALILLLATCSTLFR